MENFDTVLIIAALIQLITLIVFFVMAANVSKIKKELQKELSYDDYIERYEEEKFIGNKQNAKELLMRLYFKLQKEIDVLNSQGNDLFKEDRINSINVKREKIFDLIKDLE